MITLVSRTKAGHLWLAWCWFLARSLLTKLVLTAMLLGLLASLTDEPEFFDAGAPLIVLLSLVWKANRHLWLKKRLREIPAWLHWTGTIILVILAVAAYAPLVRIAHFSHIGIGHWGCEFGKILSGYPHEASRPVILLIGGPKVHPSMVELR